MIWLIEIVVCAVITYFSNYLYAVLTCIVLNLIIITDAVIKSKD
jgi:hypothetical protein